MQLPSKTKPAEAVISEQAIRDRAYFLWEAAGRPDGAADHYWHQAHREATRALIEAAPETSPKAPRSRQPTPDGVAPAKASKSKAKATDKKPAKKAAPKPRAAVQKI